MLIVLEGVDCSGKTTLANELNKELGYQIIHGSSFETAKLSPIKLMSYKYNLAQKDNVILDRHVYSNRVYAKHYNDYARITDKDVSFLESVMKKDKKALLVFLYTDEETFIKRKNVRGEDYVDTEKFSLLVEEYKRELVNSSLDVLSIDTSHLTPNEVKDEVMKTIRIMEARA